MPSFRQPSFAGGELSPLLWGRNDLAKYPVGLRKARNFFISRHGAAVSRPGTLYKGTVKTSADGPVRLVPFIYSDSLAYVLEFGNGYIRYWNGSLQLTGGVPYETVSPYATADLPKLQYAQQGAVLTLTHPSYAPRELALTGIAPMTWVLSTLSFDRPAATCQPTILEPMPTADGTHVAREWEYAVTQLRRSSRGNVYETAPYRVLVQAIDFFQPWNSLITYASGTKVLCSGKDAATGGADGGTVGHVYQSTAGGNLNHNLATGSWTDIGTTVTSPPPKQTDAIPSTFPVTTDRPVILQMRDGDPNGLSVANDNLVANRVYRGRGSVFGWVGDTKTTTFTDVGIEPDFTQQPPQGTNPFKVYDDTGALTRTEVPACATYFEGRRLFARTTERPGMFWGSAVGDYYDFDKRLVPIANEAYSFDLASRKLEEIRSLIGVGPRLLALTNSRVWTLNADGQPVTVSSVDAKSQGEVGSSWLQPLVIDTTVLFSRTKGTGIRAASFDLRSQGLASQDLSLFSSHLFNGHQVVDWCYAEDPWSIIWAVREDGVLLSLTYVPEQEVWAWAWHDTQGKVEAVCSVPNGLEDTVYMVVARTVNGATVRMVEQQASRTQVPGPGFPYLTCLDACSQQFGVPGPDGKHISGLSYLEGCSVMALVDGNIEGPYTVTGGTIVLDVAVRTQGVCVGLPYTSQLQTLDLAPSTAEVRTKPKNVHHVAFEVDTSKGVLVGADFDVLDAWNSRAVSDAFSPPALSTTLVRMAVTDTWNIGAGRAVLQQTPGLPVTVLSILREVEFGQE